MAASTASPPPARSCRANLYCKTKSLDTRFKNIRAAAVELTSEDLREIESAASKITVQGARYPERLEYSGSLRKRRTGDFTFS